MKMNWETEVALNRSIHDKWANIVIGKAYDSGTHGCALCELFVNRTGTCTGCPVKAKTKKNYCRGTPYDRWLRAQKEERYQLLGMQALTARYDEHVVIGPKTQAAAIAEYNFLVRLLP